jgi:hypothetical protein
MERLFGDPRVRIGGQCLLDGWSLGAIDNHPIPFDLANARRFHMNNDQAGLDYGFIAIDQHSRRLLEANQIRAVEEVHWRNQHLVDFTHFGVLGIPRERVTSNERMVGGEAHVSSTADPFYIPVTWVEDLSVLPEELRPETTFPRFVGRIPNQLPIRDMNGMSGGPILGYQDREGVTQYWVVAIQSSWNERHRVIFGCVLAYIGAMIDQDLEEFDQAQEQPEG